MKDKKSGVGLLVTIIIAFLLVGIVSYITLPSITKSVTSIFEPLKKLVGIETSKAEASATNTQDCTIPNNRYYWSKNSVKIGENAEIIIEGSGNCDGKSINIDVFKYVFLRSDQKYQSMDAQFKEGKAKFNLILNENDQFYFIFKFGTYTSPKSERIKVA